MKLPKGWSSKKVYDLADVCGGIQKGPHREPGANPVRYLTVAHVQRNRILTGDPRFFEVTPHELQRWRLEPLDILIIEGNGSADQVGRTALYHGEFKECVHQNHVIRIRVDQKLISPHYLNAFFNSAVGQAAVQSQSMTSSGLRTLSVGRIRDIEIPFPPFPEQCMIADILTTWDKALEKLDTLIAAKERRKQALMQQLLTGKKRFKGFEGKWTLRQFPDVFERVEQSVVGTPPHVLSITAGKGFVDQRKKFSRVIAGRNIENYVHLRKGEFAYNKGNSDRYPQGCIYRLEEFEEGAVPNVWISFRLKAQIHSPLFYKHFFLAGGLNRQLQRLINSGVRNDGLLNLTPDNFFRVKVPVPPEIEQTKLGILFEIFAEELSMLHAKRDALDQQKRGLMQQLLTGQVRVKP